jgi:hypothetical protein
MPLQTVEFSNAIQESSGRIQILELMSYAMTAMQQSLALAQKNCNLYLPSFSSTAQHSNLRFPH